MSRVITAATASGATLWAAFDPSVHHVVGKVADSRFAARLAPFRSREEAEAALDAACAAPTGSAR